MSAPAAFRNSVFILGVSSDMGSALAERYLNDGCLVVGTYRQKLSRPAAAGLTLLPCDVGSQESMNQTVAAYTELGQPWDIFISAVGTEEPIGPFFDCDFKAWEESVIVNSTAQLRMLHALYPHRRKGQITQAAFFAGGGTNNAFANYSAYCISKIMLIKMCELLADENPDLNVFILGPGFVRTKIHQQTLNSRAAAGNNYEKTIRFLTADDPGTSHDDIYRCVNWCIAQGRNVAGGRNFSVVHDPWRDGGEPLAEQLRNDPDKFKLRRHRNADCSDRR
jgi:NAD(P)-dependent dehydrogenase (short-subunit alcohol dehydrogenase family)